MELRHIETFLKIAELRSFTRAADELCITQPTVSKQIVDLELRNARDQLKRRGLELELSEKLRDLLNEKGYDPDMGARPLRRAVRQYVEDPVALHLLHDEREQYEGVVRIDLDADGEIEVEIIEEQLTIKPLKPTP